MTHLTTLGVDIKLKHTEIGGRKIKLQIWDTAGQERFYTITKNYFRAAEGIILAFAINDRDSF
jgi:GTPase SAR1 family protein